MSQSNCNTETRKGKHLTERERYQIEILLKEGLRPIDISIRLGRDRRTIERDRSRGSVRLIKTDLTYQNTYCADTAQRKYFASAQNKGPCLKISHDHLLVKHIEDKIINHKYSPDAVIGEIKAKGLQFKTSICTKTLYNYIDKNVFVGITNKDLPVKKNKKKRGHKKVKIAHKNLKGTSIEDRPASVDNRQEYGDWEMDCVVGLRKGKGPALLVLTERKTRQEIIRKLPFKTQECVLGALDTIEIELEDSFEHKFRSITVDNGSEFLNFKWIERSVISPGLQRTKVYYAHPYSSWERGSNETANKLIRRFIPKGTDLAGITEAQIQQIEHWMNNYPRKIHGYKSANDMAA